MMRLTAALATLVLLTGGCRTLTDSGPASATASAPAAKPATVANPTTAAAAEERAPPTPRAPVPASSLVPPYGPPQPSPLSADDQALLRYVETHAQRTEDIARQLWTWAEVGYQETKSSGLLKTTLADAGFTVQSGVAGMPTSFVASYGDGKPVIAVLAEFDALPGINQDTQPTRSPIDGKRAGHGCGHNLFGAGSVQAALAVQDWIKRTKTPGTIRVYGTPAEEGGSGKVYMVRAGLFKDVDATLHWHASDQNSAAARTSLANRSAKFRFYGVSAHAAGAPERARSALDGVEAFNHMVNLLREHIPQQARIHYVITHGGLAPNVVPDFAEVFYYVRHPKADQVMAIWKRVEAAARGAAEGTGTRAEWEVIHGNHPLLVNETMARMVDQKLRQVGGIQYNNDDRTFAASLARSLKSPRRRLGDEKRIEPYGVSLGYGSTDVGDVSMMTPTAGLLVATWPPGTAAHSWQAVAASGHPSGFRGANHAAKVLALAAAELFTNTELRQAAHAELMERRGPAFKYIPLLGDRAPPLDYRK